MVSASYMEYVRRTLEKNKQRAVGILFLLGTILVLMATWDLPQDRPPQLK
jgi:hypothetical protein